MSEDGCQTPAVSVLDPAGDPLETVLEAAEGCPTMAITVFEADTGEQLFP